MRWPLAGASSIPTRTVSAAKPTETSLARSVAEPARQPGCAIIAPAAEPSFAISVAVPGGLNVADATALVPRLFLARLVAELAGADAANVGALVTSSVLITSGISELDRRGVRIAASVAGRAR